jgi:hypothetical protein
MSRAKRTQNFIQFGALDSRHFSDPESMLGMALIIPLKNKLELRARIEDMAGTI